MFVFSFAGSAFIILCRERRVVTATARGSTVRQGPVFFFKQKTAYEIMPSLVGSEMCIRDRFIILCRERRGVTATARGSTVRQGPVFFFKSSFSAGSSFFGD